MEYKIISNERLISDAPLYDMRLYAPDIADKARPGQIAHLACGDGTLLRRPLSICDADPHTGIVRFCYEVRGTGTAYLCQRQPDECADVLGPCGHGFDTASEARRILLVGGGIGIYPLLSLARVYRNRASALLGFRTASLINLTEDFETAGAACRLITDDGSSGRKGFVTALLSEELEQNSDVFVCVCGPKPMMKAVAQLCAAAEVRCQVSMEEHMACGVGACLGCVCKTMFRENGVSREHYKRVCVDGPVFEAAEIIW